MNETDTATQPEQQQGPSETIGKWHEHDSSFNVTFNGPEFALEEQAAQRLYRGLKRLLPRLGFTCATVPRIVQHYPILNRLYRGGRQGDLEYELHQSGRCVELEFFQNVVFENPHGGQHDFGKLAKMPYLVRKRYELTAIRLKTWLSKRGLRCDPPGPSWWEDPLGCFNHRWDSDYERRRGIHRFERGPDGWPSERELSSWRRTDAEGERITQGSVRYVEDRGRWLRCRVYGGINGMWYCLTEPGQMLQVPACWIRSTFPGPGRRFSTDHRRQAILRNLQRAARQGDFLRMAAISRAIHRLYPGELIELQVNHVT